jgi:hypothetical protein
MTKEMQGVHKKCSKKDSLAKIQVEMDPTNEVRGANGLIRAIVTPLGDCLLGNIL